VARYYVIHFYPKGSAGYAAASNEQVIDAANLAYAHDVQILTHANGGAASDQRDRDDQGRDDPVQADGHRAAQGLTNPPARFERRRQRVLPCDAGWLSPAFAQIAAAIDKGATVQQERRQCFGIPWGIGR
jgi:hypothetical protein